MAVAPRAEHPKRDNAFYRRVERKFLMLGNQQGKVGWILLWAIGVPVPLLVLLFLVRGCT
jgi:hypothetical protein